MKRRVLAGAALAALAAWPGTAGASGDYGCTLRWTLDGSSYQCAGSALIGPRNDTRVNLALLLRDPASAGRATYPARGWDNADFGHVFLDWDTLQAAFWPSGGAAAPNDAVMPDQAPDQAYAGSRCQTLESGAAAFRAALGAGKGLKPGERETLLAARDLVKPACDGDKAAAAWPGVASAAGQGWLAYLQGARAFYADDFATAAARFAALVRAKDPWLAETGRYMVARNELATAQAHAFDEWGGYVGGDKVDRPSAGRARAALEDYLSAYPKGRYAGSARGLLRRAAWLVGDAQGLARSYSALPANPAMLEEVDSKVFFGTGLAGTDAPLLLATWDLMRMRRAGPDPWTAPPPPLTAAELDAQERLFAKQPELYGFLQASFAYHATRDYRRVLALLPDDARRNSYTPLAFSRQMLRGLALEQLRDRNAAGFWRELLGGARDLFQRPAVELALAMNQERGGQLAQVYAAGSPVTELEIRTRLLAHVAGPDLLRRQSAAPDASPAERDVALFTLIAKDLSRGRYADARADLGRVPAGASTSGWVAEGWSSGWLGAEADARAPVGLFARGKWQDGYPCPALGRTVATLAAQPTSVPGRLCLAEFWRLNGFDDYLAAKRPPADQLGGSADLFPGTPATRAALYAGVLADRAASPQDTAYALYRSVQCYAPSGNNACGGKDMPETQRKAWFQRLKREYPQSQWAIGLKYYW